MNCPPEIAQVVLEILYRGLLRIRAFAGAKEAKKCFIESDHLHNLPSLLADYRPEKLRYYWEVERPSFIQQVPENERRDLMPLWIRLEELVKTHAGSNVKVPGGVEASVA
jgi:hypothetical protein